MQTTYVYEVVIEIISSKLTFTEGNVKVKENERRKKIVCAFSLTNLYLECTIIVTL